MSCDTYYYQLGNEMGIDAIHDFMLPFGFGQLTGIDLLHEQKGILPSQEWKRDRFKRNRAAQKWVGGDTISISIGNGFNSFTPLQMAHAVATLANDGVLMKPHLVKLIEDAATRARTATVPKESGRIPLKQGNIDIIKHAMVGVTSDQSGTGFIPFRNAGYTVGGKTGTAQVVGLKGGKYNASATPERLRDNALFTAFAPADKPRIAIAVVVENAGFGAAIAAPIVRKALDYYLLGKRPGEKDKPAPAPKEDVPTPVEAFAPDAGADHRPGGETAGNKE
jgi:penicillin-binding protein 2